MPSSIRGHVVYPKIDDAWIDVEGDKQSAQYAPQRSPVVQVLSHDEIERRCDAGLELLKLLALSHSPCPSDARISDYAKCSRSWRVVEYLLLRKKIEIEKHPTKWNVRRIKICETGAYTNWTENLGALGKVPHNKIKYKKSRGKIILSPGKASNE